jgi:SAM-dependent methyltransferase
MKEDKQPKQAASAKSLEQKSTWYSPVANIYYRARPPYPTEQIARITSLAQLSSKSSILEIGCGPGNATVAFAQLGFSMTCLDPNQSFCELAKSNCAVHSPKVEVLNTSFEKWQPAEKQSYDAVLSANAFHWLLPKIKYAKSSEVLKTNGYLMLLWNLTPEPEYEVYKQLEPLYKEHVPSLCRHEGEGIQREILENFSLEVEKSNYFEKPTTEYISSKVVYKTDDYIDLLTTLRKIEPQAKELLSKGVKERVGESVQLSFLSAIQVAQKTWRQ